MQETAQFLEFLAAAFGFALAMWPLLKSRHPGRWSGFVVYGLVFATPLIIAAENVPLRAVACVLTIELYFKMIDFAGQPAGEDQRFSRYARFLIPVPILLVCLRQRTRRGSCDFSRLLVSLGAALVFALCFETVLWLSHSQMVRSSFLLDHTLKFFLFTVAIESLSRMLHRLEQAAGFETPPLIDSAFRSRTVSEFWYRYNTRVHSWFDCNVFLPAGGRRSPVRAILLTFFLSAILHEVGFAIATSRVDGYQFAFFLLQAPAVVLGRAIQQKTKASPAAGVALHVSTILWMWATSMLFFHGVDRVFPFFYAADPWLS